jgi:hypothetical protein
MVGSGDPAHHTCPVGHPLSLSIHEMLDFLWSAFYSPYKDIFAFHLVNDHYAPRFHSHSMGT